MGHLQDPVDIHRKCHGQVSSEGTVLFLFFLISTLFASWNENFRNVYVVHLSLLLEHFVCCFISTSAGLLFQDPVVCRLNRNTQCHVALGRRLHLQMVMEHFFYLIQRGESSNEHFILEYTHSLDPPKPTSPRWQFVNDNKTMILSRAERSDSGKYTLVIIDQDKNVKTHYSLQLNVEGRTTPALITSHSTLQH